MLTRWEATKLSALRDLATAYRIASEGGRWFSVEFIKRDGSLRKMVCRLGVKSHLRGGKQAYDPQQYNLMTVFDAGKLDYRMVPTDPNRVLRVKGRGTILFENNDVAHHDAQE